ncbi:high mobility group box, partial [Gymnopus androsaceus JB14]
IPRPRNAFILFRCDFVRQKKVPDHVEANHRNISRIVGTVWKNMSTSQKAPWIAMADMEKKNHAKAHPGYKY